MIGRDQSARYAAKTPQIAMKIFETATHLCAGRRHDERFFLLNHITTTGLFFNHSVGLFRVLTVLIAG
jgi:hypothetical protein